MIKYGLDWGDVSEATVELKCYRDPQWVKKLGGTPDAPIDHFIRALHILFIDPYKHLPYEDRPLIWNKWTEEHAHIWVNEQFATVWGPAAAGKSNDFGCFAVLDFWAAPKHTCIFVCSTTKAMLEKRIWESVKRYFGLYSGQTPGKLSKSRTAIINTDDQDTDDVKAGIHGIAVLQGTVQEAKSNIIGVHLPYVRLIVDEMQSTRRAAVEARANLSKGCKDFRFFGLANPSSLLDLSGEYSEPLDGWNTVDVTTHTWKTRWGSCYHYDGFNSPAVTEEGGSEKYPFLINQSQIDHAINECGDADHPDIWTFVRGWPAMQSEYDHVISESMIARFKMRGEKPSWQDNYMLIAGLDPAYSSGGDKCIFQPAKVGIDIDGNTIIEFIESYSIAIQATNPDPPSYQVAKRVIAIAEELGIDIGNITVDETASQSVGAIIDAESGSDQKTNKVMFGSKPSERPISVDNGRIAANEYKNKVAEIWYGMREFGRYGHIRGLPFEAARQFCMREVERGTPKKLETKDKMKERLHRSPDDADACALVIAHVRDVMGLLPGEKRTSINIESKGRAGVLPENQKETLAQLNEPAYASDVSGGEFSPNSYEEW